MESVDHIMRTLAGGAGAYDDLEIDVLSHSLQCAELLAVSHPHDPQLIAAGLVHDISDIVDPGAHQFHERLGAEAVRPVLGERVARLVAGHVEAKRYLMSRVEGRRLSPRSSETFPRQGGPMTSAEMTRFEADPDFQALVALREADDAAKVPGLSSRGLESWRPLLSVVASSVELQVD